jgi:serine/threonine protein kinase
MNDPAASLAVPTMALVSTKEQELSPTDPHNSHNSDILWEELAQGTEKFQVLAIGGMGYVYRHEDFAYKQNCFQREFDMMKMAGDCAVKAIARVIKIRDGGPVMTGLLMELETPFDVKSVQESEREAIMGEMIDLVSTLHQEYRIVHGDVKPANMLRCRDGKLRFCDFDSARPLDEDPQAWEGMCTDQYLAPNRDYFWSGSAPTPSDDLYALGLSLWELYTGKEALSDELHNMEEVLKERRTVDLMKVEDTEARSIIRAFLRQGGALV